MKTAATVPATTSHAPAQNAASAQADNRPATVLQRQALAAIDGSPRQVAQRQQAAAALPPPRPNRTGLPDQLKAGVEHLSGHSLDDVQVHYNSARPAALQAHAFAQGTAIHLAPGQEQHLPHEAWHVAQQKQGRVRPTTQLKGVGLNDNDALEQEATHMGNRALSIPAVSLGAEALAPPTPIPGSPVQRYFDGRPDDETVRSEASQARLTHSQIDILLAEAQNNLQNFGQLANRINQLRQPPNLANLSGSTASGAGQDDVEMQEPTAPSLDRTSSAPKRKRTQSLESANIQPSGTGSILGLAPGLSPSPSLGDQAVGLNSLPGGVALAGPPTLGLATTSTTEKRPEKRTRVNPSFSLHSEADTQPDLDLTDEPDAQQEELDADIMRFYGLDEQPPTLIQEDEFEEKSSSSHWTEGLEEKGLSGREDEYEAKGSSSHLAPDLAEASSASVWELAQQDEAVHATTTTEEQAQAKEEKEDAQIEELFDEARGLALISFGEGDVRVLTEKFTHKEGGKESARTRPIEWNIPFVRWNAGAKGESRTTPPPMSLFSPSKSPDWLNRDQGFDPKGEYQFGHMLPASSGAPEHYALTTPMEQDTNQAGAWKKMEESIDRILGTPKEPEETEIAKKINAGYTSETDGDGSVHIIAKYDDPDQRIPSSYQVALYGTNATGTTQLHKFAEIKNKFSRPGREKMPSPGLKALFVEMHAKMKVLDAEVAESAKKVGDAEDKQEVSAPSARRSRRGLPNPADTRERHRTDNEWTPNQGQGRTPYPARNIPEKHVPRPHRALDVLVETLSKFSRVQPEDGGPSPYENELTRHNLSPEEYQEVDAIVRRTPYGTGRPFVEAQLGLAERHARFMDPSGNDRFLSDTRPEALKNLQVPESLRTHMGMTQEESRKYLHAMYLDGHHELRRGGGHARPEGDHHVPMSTGNGSNYFTNLLWVSHQQNMSSKAQNKPADLTNPHMKKPENESEFTRFKETKDSIPKKQNLTTIAKGKHTTTPMTAKMWSDWQAARGAKPLVEPLPPGGE